MNINPLQTLIPKHTALLERLFAIPECETQRILEQVGIEYKINGDQDYFIASVMVNWKEDKVEEIENLLKPWSLYEPVQYRTLIHVFSGR